MIDVEAPVSVRLQLAYPRDLSRPRAHIIREGDPVTACGLLAQDWVRGELWLKGADLCHWCEARVLG